MEKIKVYNSKGEVIKEVEADAKFFTVQIKPVVVQQVVEAHLANRRSVLAHTKGRSEIRGGGKKPWRQKGTGRARHGSIRSPLWRGGGITFGPTKERNFKKSVNQKVKNLALRMVLADKLINQQLIVVDNLTVDQPKTKKLVEILNKLPVKNHSTLLVLDKKDEAVIRSSHNLTYLNNEPIQALNVYDVLKNRYLLTTLGGLEKIVKFYSSKLK